MASIPRPDMSTARIWANSTNPADIEDPTVGKYATGWEAEIPTYQNFNYIQKTFSEYGVYIAQEGLLPWVVETSHTAGSMVRGSDDIIYQALADNDASDPVSNPSNWQIGALGSVASAKNTAGLGQKERFEMVTARIEFDGANWVFVDGNQNMAFQNPVVGTPNEILLSVKEDTIPAAIEPMGFSIIVADPKKDKRTIRATWTWNPQVNEPFFRISLSSSLVAEIELNYTGGGPYEDGSTFAPQFATTFENIWIPGAVSLQAGTQGDRDTLVVIHPATELESSVRSVGRQFFNFTENLGGGHNDGGFALNRRQSNNDGGTEIVPLGGIMGVINQTASVAGGESATWDVEHDYDDAPNRREYIIRHGDIGRFDVGGISEGFAMAQEDSPTLGITDNRIRITSVASNLFKIAAFDTNGDPVTTGRDISYYRPACMIRRRFEGTVRFSNDMVENVQVDHPSLTGLVIEITGLVRKRYT